MSQVLQDTLSEVENERNKLSTLFLHMTDGVVAFSASGQVIHFNGSLGSGSSATIEVSHLDAFSKGRRLKVMNKPASDPHGEAVVAEARRQLEESSAWNGKYSFTRKNCEDFANHCFCVEYDSPTGRKKGKARWSQRAKTIATAAVVTVTTVVVRRRRQGGPPQA